jgi:hypothetical protein
MIEHLDLIYVAPMFATIFGRIVWWMFWSQPGDQFLPDEKKYDCDDIMMVLTLWPLFAICLIVVAIVVIAGWPFYFAVKSIRNWRISRSGSIQNVSGGDLWTATESGISAGIESTSIQTGHHGDAGFFARGRRIMKSSKVVRDRIQRP